MKKLLIHFALGCGLLAGAGHDVHGIMTSDDCLFYAGMGDVFAGGDASWVGGNHYATSGATATQTGGGYLCCTSGATCNHDSKTTCYANSGASCNLKQ